MDVQCASCRNHALHVVFVYRPAELEPKTLKAGYDWAYREFYRWPSIARASLHQGTLKHQVKQFFYASGWKKFEPLWDMLIRARQLTRVTPLLEGVLARVSRAERSPEPVREEEMAVMVQDRG